MAPHDKDSAHPLIPISRRRVPESVEHRSRGKHGHRSHPSRGIFGRHCRGRLRLGPPPLGLSHRHHQVHRMRLLRPRLPGRKLGPRKDVPDVGRALRDPGRRRGLRRLSRWRRARLRPGHPRSQRPQGFFRAQAVQPLPTRLPASRSVPSVHPSPPATASFWWTRSTASAADTASRRARTAAGSSTPKPTPPTSAPCAITASPRANGRPVSRSARSAHGGSATAQNPDDEVIEILATQRVEVLQPELLTRPQCFYLGLDMEVR